MRLLELAALVSSLGIAPEGTDPGLEITGARGLAEAGPGDVSFIKDKKHLREALPSGASLVLVGRFYDGLPMPQMLVADPYRAYAVLLGVFNPLEHGPSGVSPEAHVSEGARIGEGATLMPGSHVAGGALIGARTVLYPGVYVGRGSGVGNDCVLWPGVVIRDGVTVGDRVIIHPGAVIGADGFGFVSGPEGHFKVPQAGGVTIEDDVEIGANSTVDRATTGMTVIGRGSKIDNLVQIGHNVRMGRGCLIVAGTVIGGSCRIGDGVVMGGQCAIRDNVKIASGAILAARTAVGGDLEQGVYGGGPAFEYKRWLKAAVAFEQLPDMLRRLRELERASSGGSSSIGGVNGIMDIREIMKRLPHRYPFLLIDRVISTEPFKRIEAIKNVTFNEPHFTGHFPELPIMPGVLQIEAMAQTAGLLAITSMGELDQNCYLLGIDNAKFRKPVIPGDQLRITAEVTQHRGKVWKFAAKAHVGDVLVSEAEISAMTTEKES